eukprot:scaffold21573_cov39-Phaeocystis_antarctica.AAC.1
MYQVAVGTPLMGVPLEAVRYLSMSGCSTIEGIDDVKDGALSGGRGMRVAMRRSPHATRQHRLRQRRQGRRRRRRHHEKGLRHAGLRRRAGAAREAFDQRGWRDDEDRAQPAAGAALAPPKP